MSYLRNGIKLCAKMQYITTPCLKFHTSLTHAKSKNGRGISFKAKVAGGKNLEERYINKYLLKSGILGTSSDLKGRSTKQQSKQGSQKSGRFMHLLGQIAEVKSSTPTLLLQEHIEDYINTKGTLSMYIEISRVKLKTELNFLHVRWKISGTDELDARNELALECLTPHLRKTLSSIGFLHPTPAIRWFRDVSEVKEKKVAELLEKLDLGKEEPTSPASGAESPTPFLQGLQASLLGNTDNDIGVASSSTPSDVPLQNNLYGLDRAASVPKNKQTEIQDVNFDPESFEDRVEKRTKRHQLRQQRVGKGLLDNTDNDIDVASSSTPNDVPLKSNLYGLDRAALVQHYNIVHKNKKTETMDVNFDPESFEDRVEKRTKQLKLYQLRQQREGKRFNKKPNGLTKSEKQRIEDEIRRNIGDLDI